VKRSTLTIVKEFISVKRKTASPAKTSIHLRIPLIVNIMNNRPSHVVSQHQFQGVGIEIILVFKIWFIKFPDIMPYHHNRYNERN